MGTSSRDGFRAVAVDSNGSIIAGGVSSSTSWPTINAYQNFLAGGTRDAVIAKFSLLAQITATPAIILSPTPTTVLPTFSPLPTTVTPRPTSRPRIMSPVYDATCQLVDTDGIATIKDLECIFASVVNVILGFAGFTLFIMLLYGGFKYIISEGDPKNTQSAQRTITYAIRGIILIVLSYLILVFIEALTGVNLTIFSVTA